MRWSPEDVARYLAWYETPAGAFALARERALVNQLTSSWPRRQQTLLEVGCGPGVFLETFYQAGFDISGLDASPDMLDAAKKRLGQVVDLQLGVAEHLPYRDKKYDYVALITTLEFVDDPWAAVREAVRVARKGVLIGFLNRYSLYALEKGHKWPWSSRQSLLRQARWKSWPEIRSYLHRAAGGRRELYTRSVLAGPMSTWRDATPWRQLNQAFLPPYFGAFVAARVDLIGEPPVTPLLAFKAAKP